MDDAVGAGAVQAAEDIQALVLTPVEVQTEDGREDEQHHGEVKHDHNGRLGRKIQRKKKRGKQCEKKQRTVCEIADTLPQLGRVRAPFFFFFSISDHSLESKEKPYSKSPARNTKRARRGETERKERKECQNERTTRRTERKEGREYICCRSEQNHHPSLTPAPEADILTGCGFQCVCVYVSVFVCVCLCVSDHPQLVTDQSKPP